MKIRDIDDVTIYVNDLETTRNFYHEVFDLPVINETKKQLTFQMGKQKLYAQLPTASGQKPKKPTPGSAEFSLIVGDSLTDLTAHLNNYFIKIVSGPEEEKGHNGLMYCLSVNDPDQNLVKLKTYTH